MSMTFDVYPAVATFPSFARLLAAATEQLHLRLLRLGIDRHPQVALRIQECRNHKPVPFDLDGPLLWANTVYAWFHIPGIPGGTDAYFTAWPRCAEEVWTSYLADSPHFQPYAEHAARCMVARHYWTFRRSAGQPGVICLLYGLLAGCLAELTDGLVLSEDSAWDWALMPMTGRKLLDGYLDATQTADPRCQEWARQCLEHITAELFD